MKLDRTMEGRKGRADYEGVGELVVVALVIAVATLLLTGESPGRQDDKQAKDKKASGKSAGVVLSQDATAEDVGLPLYPRSQRLKESPDESSSVQLGLWGRSGGFKLVVLKLESVDSPAQIAAFYRTALSKYGQVLDCSKPPAKPDKAGSSQSNALDCEDDEPVAGGFTLKAGTKDKQHVVGVAPKGNHSKIALIYLENPKP
jgi:hypothetical protein